MTERLPWDRVGTRPLPVSNQYGKKPIEKRKLQEEQTKTYLISTHCTSPNKLLKSILSQKEDEMKLSRKNRKEENGNPKLEQDLYISSDEDKEKEQSVVLTTPLKKKKVENIKFKSMPFVSSSESDDDIQIINPKKSEIISKTESVLESIPKKKSTEQNTRSTIMIDRIGKIKRNSKLKQQCKFILKKGVRKGEKCPHWQRDEFCNSHRTIRENQVGSATPKTDLSVEEIKHVVTQLGEILTKFEKITSQNCGSKEVMKEMKLNQLNKKFEYELIRYLDGKAVVESEKGKVKVKIPKSMGKPEPSKNVRLVFDTETNMFQWKNS